MSTNFAFLWLIILANKAWLLDTHFDAIALKGCITPPPCLVITIMNLERMIHSVV